MLIWHSTVSSRFQFNPILDFEERQLRKARKKNNKPLKNETEKAQKGRTEQQQSVKAQKEQPHISCSPFSLSQGQVKLETPQGGMDPENSAEENHLMWQKLETQIQL